MLCNKCHKNIPQGKEMQVEGTIICKECSLDKKKLKREIVTKCHTCSNLIYKDERIYESSSNFYKGDSFVILIEHFFGSKKVEKIIQCDCCYQEWKNEKMKIEKWWKWRKWFLNILVCVLLIFLLHFFYPQLAKRYAETSRDEIAAFFILYAIAAFIIESSPKVSRYKVKKKKRG